VSALLGLLESFADEVHEGAPSVQEVPNSVVGRLYVLVDDGAQIRTDLLPLVDSIGPARSTGSLLSSGVHPARRQREFPRCLTRRQRTPANLTDA
jgi:hypothetical protein